MPRTAAPIASGLRADGVAELGAVADASLAERAVEAVGALLGAGLPAVFVYVFDEIWAIGERVRGLVEQGLGVGYALIEDAWAWRIEPGGAGWPPHRGRPVLLDRARPELINTWVALSEVERDRSCIRYVPLPDDPSYPGALDRVEADPTAEQTAPLPAGHALAWNANLLHWGGPCAENARGARTSCSFSLVRRDALAEIGVPEIRLEALSAASRLALIARQIRIYGEGQPDVAAEIGRWAAAMDALDALVRKDR